MPNVQLPKCPSSFVSIFLNCQNSYSVKITKGETSSEKDE